MEITKREILVAICILFLMVAIGFMLSEKIVDSVDASNEKYFKSLKVDNNAETFNYAYNTNIGNMFSYGTVYILDPVSIPDISGQYAEIRKVEEEYTKHTRQVEKSKIVNGETVYYYETEVYYTWDWEDEWNWKSTQFSFLEMIFDYKVIDQYLYTYHLKTIKEDSDTRYQYYVVDTQHSGSIFMNVQNNQYSNFEFYKNQHYNSIVETKQYEGIGVAASFWIIWLFFTGAIIIIYVCLDNHYLEDRRC